MVLDSDINVFEKVVLKKNIKNFFKSYKYFEKDEIILSMKYLIQTKIKFFSWKFSNDKTRIYQLFSAMSQTKRI